jgi:hypothetical protein
VTGDFRGQFQGVFDGQHVHGKLKFHDVVSLKSRKVA